MSEDALGALLARERDERPSESVETRRALLNDRKAKIFYAID